ncbi:MAG: NADH-quinone oxidoreductase subunit C [Planctomycetota bacterium]|nr:NADH-quinone oxidoreductase subunit C [Planctomycetota bacterium]
MEFQAIVDRLRALNAPGIVEVDEPRAPDKETKDKGRSGRPFVMIEPASLVDILHLCRDDERLQMEVLIDITASDPAVDDANLWILVELLSVKHRHRLALKALLPKANPVLPSATAIYRAAQWHERECAEMYGVTFEGHPDPRNILLPDDWVGHPMRKDYEFPTEYHGISCE